MKLINKSRGTGKTKQLIYTSVMTGFRIITPNRAMAKHIEEMAKNMGLEIPEPMSDTEYRSRKYDGDHAPILIDDVENGILCDALELYFNAPVATATMSVPIDDGYVELKSKLKTNRDVFNEHFGNMQFTLNEMFSHIEDALTIRTEDGEDMKFTDWLNRTYVERKEKNND